MSLFGSRLKKFDVHVKVVEGVSQQTSIGAVITIICLVLTCLLSYSELNLLFRSDRSSHVILDQISTMEAVKLNFDVEFHKIACSDLSFSQEVVRGTVHQFLDDDHSLRLEDAGEGCRVRGSVKTDKVAGNFRFKVKPQHVDQKSLQVQAPHPSHYPNLDMSHEVKNIYFESKNDVVTRVLGLLASPPTPLKSQVTSLGGETGLYHYGLQIVPSMKKRNGKLQASDLNSYSVTERRVKLADLNRGLSLGGTTVQNFVGVIFTYEFYPVAVVTEINRQGILQFLVSLCAIIGGLVTVMSLVDKCLHRSMKAIIGKED